MAYNEKEIEELAKWLFKNGFIDIQDVDPAESFLDYGVMRNPYTNKVVICRPSIGGDKYVITYTSVNFEEMKEDMEYISEAFFDYCGVKREEALKDLGNSRLSYWISTVNKWNGSYTVDGYFDFNIEQLKFSVNKDKEEWDRNERIS